MMSKKCIMFIFTCMLFISQLQAGVVMENFAVSEKITEAGIASGSIDNFSISSQANLLVGVVIGRDGTGTYALGYGNQNFTRLTQVTDGYEYVEIWYLTNPSGSTENINLELIGGTGNGVYLTAYSLEGASLDINSWHYGNTSGNTDGSPFEDIGIRYNDVQRYSLAIDGFAVDTHWHYGAGSNPTRNPRTALPFHKDDFGAGGFSSYVENASGDVDLGGVVGHNHDTHALYASVVIPPAPVPEPATLSLFAIGSLALLKKSRG